jgi:hypothetical protein
MAVVEKLEEFINAILNQSRVCSTIEEKRFLVKTLGGRTFKTTKLYRGSEDGFTYKDFHRLSDGKGPTLSLFKVLGTDHCIGGFTNASWSAPDQGINVADPGAVVFNLTHKTAFKVINTEDAIYCCKERGPVFTGTLAAYK